MSAIIKKQYETAKQLLKSVENCFTAYEVFGLDQNWSDFVSMSKYLLTIIDNVEVYQSVIFLSEREEGLTLIDNCRQKFAAYEAELKALGLIDNKPKLKNEDAYSMQKIEHIIEDEENQFFNRHNIEGYGI